MTGNNGRDPTNDLAVIGWSLRLPGAENPDEFWQNLVSKRATVSFFSEAEVMAEGIDPTVARDPNFVKARAILPGIDLFDAEFFGYSPREVEIMDPQQRLLLECSWEALENAGYAPGRDAGRVGVFATSSMSSYLFHNVAAGRRNEDPFHALLGNDRNHLATRVAFKLDLKGPAVNIQTACSGSLVAFHYGCQALLSGECDMALVGGASITVPQKTGHWFQVDGIYSPDGYCRAFDEKAHGIVGGNGVVVVVVKRMSEALADGDTIHAVMLGSAVNNDGARKVGYTAPGVEGQIEVISQALAVAGVDPDTIGYVEAHGTGTLIGDPIELAALTRVYRSQTRRRGYCGIGSVKSNIGHLDAAAGLAGLVKTILALKHREIPPTLHVSRPNPAIEFESSPFYVATDHVPWPGGAAPRRAGVSAFGLGGTNAHVVLEEAPKRSQSSEPARSELLVLSAKKSGPLRQARLQLGRHLSGDSPDALGDIAFTLQAGRKAFAQRCFVVANSKLKAASALLEDRVRASEHPVVGPVPVAFLFPGLGEQHAGMGLGLYRSEPVYRQAIDECLGHLAPHFETDLRRVLFGTVPDPPRLASDKGSAIDFRAMLRREPGTAVEDLLSRVELLHPLLFTTEYALGRLFLSWGIRPSALVGYSLGEYCAACLAGVFSLRDALFVVRRRAALISTLPHGAAISVQIPEARLRRMLPDGAAIAGLNGDDLFTVAGTVEGVTELESRLRHEGIAFQNFGASHPFHTQAMQAAAPALGSILREVSLRPPEYPILSTMTGSWVDPSEIATPGYWMRQLCSPVNFAAAILALRAKCETVLLELGPGRSLGSMAQRIVAAEGGDPCRTIAALGHRYERLDARDQALTALGTLWLEGVEPDWSAIHRGQKRGRVPLPTYAFDRKRYWIDPPKVTSDHPAPAPSEPARADDLEDWFYVPSWSHSLRPVAPVEESFGGRRHWLVFGGNSVSDAAIEELERQGRVVDCAVIAGSMPAGALRCRPDRPEDYVAMLRELRQMGRFPEGILHLWSAADAPTAVSGTEFDAAVLRGTGSMLLLAQALAEVEPRAPISVWVGTLGGQDVESRDLARPEQAAAAALRLVVPQEHRNQSWHVIDGAPGDTRFARDLVAELATDAGDTLVAYRTSIRWLPSHQRVRLPAPAQHSLQTGGGYLVLGGLGRIGLSLVGLLGRRYRARLVVAGDIGVNEAAALAGDLDELSEDVRRKAEVVRGAVAAGGSVRLIEADLREAQHVVGEACRLLGRIDGVIYAPGKAGLGGVAAIAQCERGLIEWHNAAKVHPLYPLAQALDEVQPGFVLLASSLSSVLGGLGLAAHATAHVAMDAFAHRMHRTGAPWISVNWNWADWGDSRADAAAVEAQGVGRTVRRFEITDAEGCETFRRAVNLTGSPQVVVSSGALEARIAQWSANAAPATERTKSAPNRATAGYARPDVSTVFVPVQGKLQEQIAAIWCDVLGLKEIGADDNFFELGGHSLLGAQVVTRLRDTFGVNVSLRTIFATPTVAAVAEAIEALAGAARPAEVEHAE